MEPAPNRPRSIVFTCAYLLKLIAPNFSAKMASCRMASLGQFLAQAKFDLETYLQKLFIVYANVSQNWNSFMWRCVRTWSSPFAFNNLFSSKCRWCGNFFGIKALDGPPTHAVAVRMCLHCRLCLNLWTTWGRLVLIIAKILFSLELWKKLN